MSQTRSKKSAAVTLSNFNLTCKVIIFSSHFLRTELFSHVGEHFDLFSVRSLTMNRLDRQLLTLEQDEV